MAHSPRKSCVTVPHVTAETTATHFVVASEYATTQWKCVTAALTECVAQHVKRSVVPVGVNLAPGMEAVTLSLGSVRAIPVGRESDVIS